MSLITDDAKAVPGAATRPPVGRGDTGRGIVDFLSDSIRSGRYAPGQRLVEAELTAELRVSRGPVREAFRRLAAEGLIEIVPNRGAVVRRLSVTDALELFEIRTQLEALAARKAAVNMADRFVRQAFEDDIAPIWQGTRRQTSDYIAENQRFHSAIIRTAGNRQLADLTWRLQLTLILSQIRSALTSDVIEASLREHRAIALAILDGDAAAAEMAIRDHLGRASALMKAVPRELFRTEQETA